MADTESNANAAGGITLPLYALLPPAVKQILLLVGLAAAVAAGVALVLWSQGENYTPLYSGLADRDVGEITAQLDSANVPYELDSATGSLLVPADRKYEVRMQLASVGLAARRRFRHRGDAGAQLVRPNAVHGERAVRARRRNRARAHDRQHAARRDGARAPRAAAAVGVLAAEARAERVRDAEAVLRAGASTTSRCSPSCTSSRRACRISSPSRVTVVDQTGALLTSPERRLDGEPHELAVRLPQASRERLLAAHPEPASARSSAQIACAPACPPRSISRRSSRRARASIRTCSSSAASKRARTRAAATACRACPARSSNQPPEVAAPPAGAASAVRRPKP